jgi:hypothetical protein
VNSTQGLSGLPAAALEGEQALLDGGEIGKLLGVSTLRWQIDT